MEIIIRKFNELTIDQLYKLLQVRTDIFVVEQNCPYSELDYKDQKSIHVWLEENNEILAYCRVLEKGVSFPEASIGRVLATKRHAGYATECLKTAIEVAKKEYNANALVIEAQVYARSLYEKLGFVQTSEEFLEDGIPHIQMRLSL